MGAIVFVMKNVRLRFYHYTFIVWFLYKAISISWALDTSMFQLHIVSQIGMVALLICMTMISVDIKTIDTIVKAMWLGSLAIGTLSIFFSRPYHGEVENRMVLYLWGSEADPNNQAAFLVVGIAIAFYYLVCLKEYKLLSIATILINFYSTMLTGSRGGLVTFLVLVFVFVALNYKKERVIKYINRLLLIGFLVIVGYVLLKKFLPLDIYNRLFLFEDYVGGSERDAIWRNTIDLILSNWAYPIFGAGWGSYFGYNGFYDSVHNTFLSIFCDTGVIGATLFFVPIMIIAYNLFKRKEILPTSILAAGLVPSLFIEAINKRFFWNALIFTIMVYNYRNQLFKKKNRYDE